MRKGNHPSEFGVVAWILATLVILFAFSDKSEAATYPFYNGFGGYTTTLSMVNTTGEPVAVPLSVIKPTIGAYGTVKFTDYPSAGGGVFDVNAPESVSVYVELTDPQGSSVRFSAIPAYTSAAIYGLTTDKNQRAEVFAASSGYVLFSFYRDDVLVSEYKPNMTNGVAIEVAPATANRVVVSQVNFTFGDIKPGPIFAIGYHRQTTGGFKIQNPVTPTEAK